MKKFPGILNKYLKDHELEAIIVHSANSVT